jgi:hypothetical protein
VQTLAFANPANIVSTRLVAREKALSTQAEDLAHCRDRPRIAAAAAVAAKDWSLAHV